MDTKATGALIAQRRKALALSQAELAERLHVTDKAVSRWETGRGMPGLDSLEPLSEALGLSVSELLSGKELTQEELPKAAGGQIMESMKREKQWKWLAWLAMAAVTALAVWGVSVSVQAKQKQAERDAHYASSVHSEDDEALAQGTAEYFQDQNTRFDPKTLEVQKRAELGDYMALLCADKGGEWCLSVWRRDELFPDRYCPIGGRSQMDTGMKGAMIHNFGDAENAVVVASGAELPEKVERFEWSNGGTRYTGPAYLDRQRNTRGVLELYLLTLEDPYNPVGPKLTLYDDAGNWIWDNFR
ncbi:helix-turn-helix domain-containing protein [Oscillibacter sp.]|uniref:helix-turn-helix domain-containing protein n=1 Tax=Oscillibacter sp. TaxID=1945593 RepID=UPI002D7F1B1E|nr:helix-turn-helix transcriptional regulator [Oscillibacter sp.]